MSLLGDRRNIAHAILPSDRKIELYARPSQHFVPEDHHSSLHERRLKPGEIRLLYLIPNENLKARVEGFISTGKLVDQLQYSALSYRCGDPFPDRRGDLKDVEARRGLYKQTTFIYVNGIKHKVTWALDEALRRLRNVKPMTGIWVDAICIHQTDQIEREQQVQQMGAIYNKTQEVQLVSDPVV